MTDPQPRTQQRTVQSELRRAYEAAGASFCIRAFSADALDALCWQYAPLRPLPDSADVDVDVEIEENDDGSWGIRIDGDSVARVQGSGQLLHELDNHLAHRLQLQSPQLYFVHSACLARDGSATMIMGDSGAGKSTTAYAMAALGLEYLSDELSAINVREHVVLPYPRAICLKQDPPAPLALPKSLLRTDWTVHVDPRDLGAAIADGPRRLERIIFLNHGPPGTRPQLKRLSSAEASLRLYQNALNQLAHANAGLDDTIRLASAAECYQLLRGDIPATLALLAESGALASGSPPDPRPGAKRSAGQNDAPA